jgi:hypothetical protein
MGRPAGSQNLDRLSPTVHGVGYLGCGNNNSVDIDGSRSSAYNTWAAMITRCYSKKHQLRFPAYVGCSVDEHWHNFQNFANWFHLNYVDGWELDKDLMVQGNKIYSPTTCCFIPSQINSILTRKRISKSTLPRGVGKSGKRFYAKTSVAGVHKHLGCFETEWDAWIAVKFASAQNIKRLIFDNFGFLDDRTITALLKFEPQPYGG